SGSWRKQAAGPTRRGITSTPTGMTCALSPLSSCRPCRPLSWSKEGSYDSEDPGFRGDGAGGHHGLQGGARAAGGGARTDSLAPRARNDGLLLLPRSVLLQPEDGCSRARGDQRAVASGGETGHWLA